MFTSDYDYDLPRELIAQHPPAVREAARMLVLDRATGAREHRVFSEHPLRSKNGQRITLGDSFESDDEFKEPHIIHQRGTIEWKEE